MTPTELKDLAEWSAEFLGFDRLQNSGEWKFEFRNVNYLLNEKDFYDEKGFAPILMHLGKREMEKRGLSIQYTKWSLSFGEKGHTYTFFMEDSTHCVAGSVSHENKFIAFWSAVYEAMKGETK